jgi:predicted dehydrogenase
MIGAVGKAILQNRKPSSMNPVRFGVIGLRRGQSLVSACHAVGSATVNALYDLDAQKGRAIADAIQAEFYTDFEAFLDAEIDAVVVASPIPYHATQSIAALSAGKHLLSEVTACHTLADAQALVMAARRANRVYMLAENCCYYDEIELVKRLYEDGRFGEIYYGEGDYVHDCRQLFYTNDGQLTWRGRGELSVYITHGLGPLLYITGDRVTQVSALAIPGGKFDPAITFPTMYILHMTTAAGRTLRARVDYVSPRPHQSTTFFALQGTRGSYESVRGFGDQAKIWLEDEHGPSGFKPPAQWHSLEDQAARYLADRRAVITNAYTGGHGMTEYWMLRDFLAAVRGEKASPIDVYTGLDYTLPGIYAVESAKQQGAPITVDDPRQW